MARGKTLGRYGPGRKAAPEEDESNRWLGTYGDAITLLMAFFVMLYAMSQIDQVKFEAFVQGLEAPFGNTSQLDGSPAIVGDAGAQTPATDPGAVTTAEFQPAPPPPVPPPTVAPPPLAPTPADMQQLEEVRKAIIASLEAEGLSGVADLELDHRGLVVSISADEVLFATGSTEISELGRRVIRAVAAPLLATANDLLVEGHTDDVPLRLPSYTNWNLSTDRAVAVLTQMYADVGIDQQRLGAVGFGEFRPRVPNDNPSNRSLNRRVDIQIAVQTKD